MIFSKWVFRIAAIYGFIVLLPLYFIESDIFSGVIYPRSDFYYGFAGIALAWQVAFILIAQNPLKYKLFIIPGILEKVAYASCVYLLFYKGRIPPETLLFAGIDSAFCLLFCISWIKLKSGGEHES